MLELVFGRSGYGKTEYVFSTINKLVQDGNRNILLITPEQFSLAIERKLLTDLKEDGIYAVNNSSFTRLADDVKRKYGSVNLPVLTKGAKLVLMVRAIENTKDKLTLFNKNIDSLSFVKSMIKINDEMKSCNLSSSEISKLSAGITNEILFRKMNDISVIMSNYENLIKDRYVDSADELTRLYDVLRDKNYFANKTVLIDGFNGFVAQEYKLLELIIKEAERVVITLCTDSYENGDDYDLFAYVNNSARIIKKIADKANIPTKFIQLKTNHRANNDAIKCVEENIFTTNTTPCVECKNSISIYSASSITDECLEVSRQIRNLLKKGVKASEISVIVRNLDKYREEMASAFKKMEIPYFHDERQPVKNQPLVLFIEYLLRCVNYSLKSDDIISLAKTGLTGISFEEINNLENYVYLWNINGLKWTKPFVNSTNGFVSSISSSDQKLLDAVNKTREELISPILKFKSSIKNADAQTVCKHIYYALIDFGADKKIGEIAEKLFNSDKTALADQQEAVWNMVMDILTQIPQALGSEKITLKEFARLFSLVISSEDLGVLPSGIDNVQLGQADRIRCNNPKAVFVVGANEGEFPQTVSEGGLLTESERHILLENDFKLYSYGEILNLQERYFAYMACCASSEKLFVSYLGNMGKDSAPSEIVTSIKSVFADIKEYKYTDIDDIDLIETKSNAFELMSENFLINTEFYSSLKEYFSKDPRFAAVKSLALNEQAKIRNAEISTELFGYNMYISASRIEDYYNCAFRYFCKYGLGARPRKKAEINPMERGTLIHYVLEHILSKYGSKKLSLMSEKEIIDCVNDLVSEYFVSVMGNAQDLNERFKYNFKRLSRLIYSVVIHLSQEFKDSDFEAKAFELAIDKDASVKPEIINLADGGTVQIRGSIDRVDTYKKNDETYVRVVDYKSGNKEFNLSDILYGLNLQMFVYLFSLTQDKDADLTGIPAGVLYMHSSRNVFSFDTKKDAGENLSSTENDSFKMKGIVLDVNDGEIAVAMEHDLLGKFIPVKRKKSGELTGQLASLEELGNIHKKINSLIAEMGNELHKGNVSRNPVWNKNHKNVCDYCDFKDVCANSKLIENRICSDLTDSQVKEELAKEYDENAAVDNTAK